uniref:embigin n=1 Tax=Scatophagus argus TaxID=75038 RepID=UPI001ED86415|nr:embigin [Scatophagus argus]
MIMSASWMQLCFQILLLFVSCRHINTKTPGPTLLPPVPMSALRSVRKLVLKALDTGDSHTEKVELLNPVNLSLECTLAGNHNKLPNITGFWKKDGREIENSRLTVQSENELYHLKRVFNIDGEENLGNYSCVFGNETKIDFVLAVPQIGEERDKPIVSYLGDSAVLTCKMDKPKPEPTTWNWYKANGTNKEQISPAAEPHRYKIKYKERETFLLVYNLTEADSGLYYCSAVYPVGTSMGHVELKVITIYEPLKPFIAILAEVTILVIAILIYEKSRSKKNSTAGNEMNDLTNTQPQEENDASERSSSMRQRKV